MRTMTAFSRRIGVDYLGEETPTSGLKGLRVNSADRDVPPVEVLPPPEIFEAFENDLSRQTDFPRDTAGRRAVRDQAAPEDEVLHDVEFNVEFVSRRRLAQDLRNMQLIVHLAYKRRRRGMKPLPPLVTGRE